MDEKSGARLVRKGDLDKAIPKLEGSWKKVRGSKSSKEARRAHLYGSALVMKGRVKEGIEVLEEGRMAAEACRGEERQQIYYALGYAYNAEKDWKKAREVLEKAVEVCDRREEPVEKARAMSHLAAAKLKGGDRKGARVMVEEANKMLQEVRKAPESVVARGKLVMAQVMEADGLREQADEEAKRALDVCKSAKAPDVRLAKEIEDFRNQLKKGSFYKIPLAVSSVVMAVGAGIFAYAM